MTTTALAICMHDARSSRKSSPSGPIWAVWLMRHRKSGWVRSNRLTVEPMDFNAALVAVNAHAEARKLERLG